MAFSQIGVSRSHTVQQGSRLIISIHTLLFELGQEEHEKTFFSNKLKNATLAFWHACACPSVTPTLIVVERESETSLST